MPCVIALCNYLPFDAISECGILLYSISFIYCIIVTCTPGDESLSISPLDIFFQVILG